MADISRREMGLIIGLVVGTLFLALIVVLAYIMYDRRRTKRAGALHASRAGLNLRSSHSVAVPIDAAAVGSVIQAGGQRWTTINNSMVGLEMCETPTSHARSVDANSGSFPPPMRENRAPDTGTSYDAGNHKTLFARLFGWTQPWHQPRLRTSDDQDSNGGRRMAVVSGVSSAAPAAAAHAASKSKHRQSFLQTAKCIPSSEPTKGFVQGADPGLAMVVLELNATSTAGCAAPAATPSGPSILPLSGCIGGAVLGFTLEPSSSSIAAADATVSAADMGFLSSSAELLLSLPLDAISAPMISANGSRAKGKGVGGANSKRSVEAVSY
ncbi:hypothetical protein VaNZ11_004317 [Volvox africanus]|uniref:Membrane-associated protein n=1 Tax=Volvox africanus TaxID=51714 RepID=A0ABQ5RW05_9CHLO|nr:hypothetical protein VaNZ11_004317 [Volvox africanus]